MFYDVLQCLIMFCNVLQCSTMFYNVLQCSEMFYNVLHCSTIFYNDNYQVCKQHRGLQSIPADRYIRPLSPGNCKPRSNRKVKGCKDQALLESAPELKIKKVSFLFHPNLYPFKQNYMTVFVYI